MLRFRCARCGEVLEAPASASGEVLDCPQCKEQVTVPGTKNNEEGSAFPRWAVITIVVLFLIAGGIITVVVHTHNRNRPAAGEAALHDGSAKGSAKVTASKIAAGHSVTGHIFEMTKSEFIAYCGQKRITPREEEWFNLPDFTLFRVPNLPKVRVNWRDKDGKFYPDSIFVGNMSVEDSVDGAQPVWAVWELLQPDLVPLFRELKAESNAKGYIESSLKWYGDGPYAYGYAANNKFRVEYVGPKSAIPKLRQHAKQCAIIYLAWFNRIKASSDKVEQQVASGTSPEELLELLDSELFRLETDFELVDVLDMGPDHINQPDFFYLHIPPAFHKDAKAQLLKTSGALNAIARLARHQLVKNSFTVQPFVEMLKALSLMGNSAYEKAWGRYSHLEDIVPTSELPEQYAEQLYEITLMSVAMMKADWQGAKNAKLGTSDLVSHGISVELVNVDRDSALNMVTVKARVTNVSGRHLSSVVITCLLHDEAGTIIDFSKETVFYSHQGGLPAGKSTFYSWTCYNADPRLVDEVSFYVEQVE